jgi:DNA mismatch repair ATPase MutS
MKEKAFEAKGLVNPAVAAKLFENNDRVSMVGNDITFDQNGMIYVLTGPNMGGKSVFLCAVGLAQLMFQIGLPVAAESLTVSPVDGIFTHFTTESTSTVGKGRLGEECERMQKIFTEISEYSFVLLDEAMSGTASLEASVIALEVLAGLSMFGCRAIYATHLHELAARVEDVNSRPDVRSKVDTLTAGMENGQRSYLIRRMKPDGQSYARDIAEKFGLSINKIKELSRAKQKMTN